MWLALANGEDGPKKSSDVRDPMSPAAAIGGVTREAFARDDGGATRISDDLNGISPASIGGVDIKAAVDVRPCPVREAIEASGTEAKLPGGTLFRLARITAFGSALRRFWLSSDVQAPTVSTTAACFCSKCFTWIIATFVLSYTP